MVNPGITDLDTASCILDCCTEVSQAQKDTAVPEKNVAHLQSMMPIYGLVLTSYSVRGEVVAGSLLDLARIHPKMHEFVVAGYGWSLT